jgi:hypothetical protein
MTSPTAAERIDNIIATIIAVRESPPGTKAALAEPDVGFLLQSVRDILASQPTLLELRRRSQLWVTFTATCTI